MSLCRQQVPEDGNLQENQWLHNLRKWMVYIYHRLPDIRQKMIFLLLQNSHDHNSYRGRNGNHKIQGQQEQSQDMWKKTMRT